MADDDAKRDVLELSRALGIDAEQLADRLAFFELGPADEEALARTSAACDSHLDQIIADFYAHLLRFPELERLLRAEPGRVSRLQGLQKEYFKQLTRGPIDPEYVETRLRVGNAHQRIGLRPEWYVGGFALLLRLCLRTIFEEEGRTLPREAEALIKTVLFDMSLALDTYIHGGFVDREAAARLEQATDAAREALRVQQETEHLKDDLTSMAVHDLKNPVNGIAMMVRLALRKGDGLPAAHVGYLKHIERTCSEMMRLIQNLLEIAKIEEGKMTVARDVIVPGEVLAEVVAEYAPVAEQAGRALHLQVPDELPEIVADRSLLKRVLVNLVANALRHSGSPDVTIDAVREPDEGSDNEVVTLRVIDRGTGLELGDQSSVFEKFRSLRRSPSSVPSSDTGLGLPFCKLAVEVMGGRIGVRSTPGDTTTFWISLPGRGS